MTRIEYKQIREFGRYDGLIIGILWMLCFAFFMWGLKEQNGLLILLSELTTIASPFLVWRRCIRFRDKVMEGNMSFSRSYLYAFLIFWHAALIIAAVLFVYFAFLDHGSFILTLNQMASDPEIANQKMVDMNSFRQFIDLLSQFTPVQHAYLSWMEIVLLSFPVSLPIAFFTMKQNKQAENETNHSQEN